MILPVSTSHGLAQHDGIHIDAPSTDQFRCGQGERVAAFLQRQHAELQWLEVFHKVMRLRDTFLRLIPDRRIKGLRHSRFGTRITPCKSDSCTDVRSGVSVENCRTIPSCRPDFDIPRDGVVGASPVGKKGIVRCLRTSLDRAVRNTVPGGERCRFRIPNRKGPVGVGGEVFCGFCTMRRNGFAQPFGNLGMFLRKVVVLSTIFLNVKQGASFIQAELRSAHRHPFSPDAEEPAIRPSGGILGQT
ncbi:MAG: hypothetical protein ACI8P0_001837 [Planctomycetaceae bacterium]|jgi:hypothetical protein